MTLPFAMGTVPLPDWLPWWVPALLLIPCLLYALLVLLMPFSVFGLKGRLEGIEARLDEIQGEIRILSLRLPASIGEDLPSGDRVPSRPPIPPVTRYPDPAPPDDDRARRTRIVRAPRPDSYPAPRAEPRFGPG